MGDKINLNKGKRGLVELSRKPVRKVVTASRSSYYTADTVLQKKVLSVLREYPKGITASQLAKDIGIHHQTVMNTLESLVALREAYDIKYGAMTIFFPNGKLNHPVNFQDVKFKDKTYSFSEILQHLTGVRYIFIQEKELDSNNILEAKGGLLITADEFEQFIETLVNFRDELNNRKFALTK